VQFLVVYRLGKPALVDSLARTFAGLQGWRTSLKGGLAVKFLCREGGCS
jgi:hypothetical protein